jgi:hypothetical protein
MAGVGRNVDVATASGELTGRLVTWLADEEPQEVVEETVAACAVRFRDARILEFVPLLTRRLCAGQLINLLGAAAPRGVAGRAWRVS